MRLPRRALFTAAQWELIHEKREERMTWKEIASQYFPSLSGRLLSDRYARYLKKLQAEEEAKSEGEDDEE